MQISASRTFPSQVSGWKKRTTLRAFVPVDAEGDDTLIKERKLDTFVRQLRISAEVKLVNWQHVKAEFELGADSTTAAEPSSPEGASAAAAHAPSKSKAPKPCPVHVADKYLSAVNELVREHCAETVVTMMYLPRPPRDRSHYERYLQQLDMLTDSLPPTVLVHGLHRVTSTTL